MKIKFARWYVALAVRVPGKGNPLCVGFGFDRYRAQARAAALLLATDLRHTK